MDRIPLDRPQHKSQRYRSRSTRLLEWPGTGSGSFRWKRLLFPEFAPLTFRPGKDNGYRSSRNSLAFRPRAKNKFAGAKHHTQNRGAGVSRAARFFSAENRYLPPLFITLILVAGNLSFGLLESFTRTALAIATSMLFEIALTLLIYRKFPNLASAYITGMSVGILIRSTALWPYFLCSTLSTTSKYVVRWRGRNLWNPSNLGI